jgi:2-deoxy-D-gluconate 3-dehydrogenase
MAGLMDLSGKVAIVTGGNGGIGLGMAQGLAEQGATVVLTGRNAAKGAAAVATIGAAASFVEADVTSKASCEALAASVLASHGRLDILINNAGTSVRKQPETYSEAEWHLVMNTNLTSAFLCSQAAYAALKASGNGKIVMIGSLMSILGAAYAAPYAASKGAIVQLTRSLACAWAKDNIQVNAILPGWIDTDLTRTAREQVDGLNDKVLTRTPAARWGSPRDLAAAAVFLSSPGAGFVTGAALSVDGGYSIQA